jgi:hypothetical protein
MGFTDLFRPKWKHSNPEVRAEAVRQLGDDQAALLATIARQDADARVRRIAVKRIADTEVLFDVAAHDSDEALREAAAQKAEELLLSLANGADDEARSLEVLARFKHPRQLALVAQKAALATVRARAVALIPADDKALAEVAKKAGDAAVRKAAVERLTDAHALRDVAIGEGHKEIGLLAVARLSDRAALDKVAQKAQSKAVRQAARDKMPPPEKKPESPEAQKRARLLGLVRIVEHATDPHELETARHQFASEGADDEMRRRFDRACERFYAKRAASARSVTKIAEKQAAEAAAHAHAEAAAHAEPAAAHAPAAEPAPPSEAELAERAAREAERAEKEAKRAETEAERQRRAEEEQKREAARAEARARREAEEKANAERLSQLTVELEGVSVDDLKRGGEALKRAQEAFDALGPTGRESAPLRARWQAARDKLRARVNELREAEDWKRWANVPKLEALCTRVEALLELTDHKEAAAQLKALQAEWKAVGPTTKEKQEQLWTRFKAAADQVYERGRAYFSTLEEQRGGNLAKKEELVARVEALADSSDWKETSELIKALQEEWKAVGPVPKDKADEVWKRFRGACDKFYDRRKAHFEANDAQRQENLQRQEEIIAAVEKLAAATDAPESVQWKRSADDVKRLQADWKALGPVPRDKSEETWKRFRAACDKFFAARQTHFAQLDEERAGNLKAKELLCEKVEALAEAPDVAEALEVVRGLQAEWKTVGPAPKDKADEVWNRFRAACDKIFQRSRQPEPPPAPAAPGGEGGVEPAPQGYSAPKLGDKLADLLKKS